MKKRGFTLVELLAVIAILAILVIIALPAVLRMYNSARKDTFKTEVRSIYKTAQNQWLQDFNTSSSERTYANSNDNICQNKLNISGRNNLEYYIAINQSGKISKLYVTDGKYQYAYKGNGLNIDEIDNIQEIDNITNGKYVQITCNSGKITSPEPISSDYYLLNVPGDSDSLFLRTTIYRKDIEKIIISDSIDGHEPNGDNCWDVSKGSNGSVLAWATDNDNNGLYEITIGTNGDVYLPVNSHQIFARLNHLTSFEGTENINTSKVTDMSNMFHGDILLENIDLSSWDTSNVIFMQSLFDNCQNIKTINLKGFDTSKVINMQAMFYACYELTDLDISTFNTENVTNMFWMFYHTSLTSLDLSHFDTSKVTNMEGMFRSNFKLKSLKLGNNFLTDSVTSMSEIFFGDRELESLDLSYWNTSGVTNINGMFSSCSSLKTIYVSADFNVSSVNNSNSMFANAISLVGGAGTTYDSSHTDKEYARIDGGLSNPGYFTLKQ